ncbi:MAG: Rha family transcriptional regulator [Ruminococcus sp.]|nr:Rha family transcriptional regulator [Ruminococcus sp.]
MNFNGVETIDSRQVAEAVGKKHFNLLQDIRTYCGYLGELNFQFTDFFIESTYKTEQNKEMPCYLCTRKGCEMIANKLTGQKGVAFTALYINAFHKMENHIRKQKPIQTAEDKAKALEVKLMNARVRMSNQFLKLAKVDTVSEEYKNILVAKSAEVLAGQPLLPLPESEQKTYSATEVGQLFGVSAQIIGRLATRHNLKNDEYGKWYHDKSPYSSKEVDTFRYNDKGVEKFREILQTK